MPSVVVKYKNQKALEALRDLAKIFDMSIEKTLEDPISSNDKSVRKLPISFAENPDVKALAGIWEGKDISLTELRKEAWGDRV